MADRFVVDTSVFLRWYVPQIGFEHAREVRQDFLTGAVTLETVDSTRFELGHVLRTKGLLKGHLTAAQYRAAVRSIDDLGIIIHGTDADALERAGELATRCTLRFFDAVLVDRALQRGMPLLTSALSALLASNMCPHLGGASVVEVAGGGDAEQLEDLLV